MNPVDWKVRSGMLQKFFPLTFPTITGRDGAGETIGAAAGADASLIGKACVSSRRREPARQAKRSHCKRRLQSQSRRACPTSRLLHFRSRA